MIEITSDGGVRVIGEKDKRLIDFANLKSELRFAAVLRSANVEIVRLGDAM